MGGRTITMGGSTMGGRITGGVVGAGGGVVPVGGFHNPLRETAQTIRKSIRDSDLLIRFGGEEFLVALLDIETGSTLEVGEKIRENVQNAPLMVGKVAIGQTISLGVSELPEDTRDFWQAIKFADLALYRAKALGRNRTVRFTGE